VPQLTKIYPKDIKFLYRYGLFLKQVVNNEYEASLNFEKICLVYEGFISKKHQGDSQGAGGGEDYEFGENSGAAIIVVSASTSEIGTIIHTSSEIKDILGYSCKELHGKNVSYIMPTPTALVHDRLI
jgi:hypothetical protein